MDCTGDEVGGVIVSEVVTLGSSAVDVTILVAAVETAGGGIAVEAWDN